MVKITINKPWYYTFSTPPKNLYFGFHPKTRTETQQKGGQTPAKHNQLFGDRPEESYHQGLITGAIEMNI
jgi:hypothetical protein